MYATTAIYLLETSSQLPSLAKVQKEKKLKKRTVIRKRKEEMKDGEKRGK